MNDKTKTYITLAAQAFLGLILGVMGGLNYFLGFMETPKPTPEAGAFLGAMAAAGYFFPFVKVVEIVGGLMLLTNRFVPLALVMLAPIIVNIFALHLFLQPAQLPMSGAMMAALVFVSVMYRKHFKTMFAFKAAVS
ncbi:hypothetical protein [Acanthopleuribacter pedis]|uniref:DoxX family protein n=1 Tax=Acanthopleuribacter pedis TaxID=442870 RepID=A0A8J7U113_9BACT|nr:hypothetical protein [Acanthopleuribacter pedis]MBO1317673.1 hypothetical protein [Acanthopleuribacter pedis]